MKERLMEFIKEKDISNRKFLLKCGLSGTYISTLTGNPSGDTLKKIEAAYPELNTEWLLTGKGEMLKIPSVVTVYNPTSEERQEAGDGINMSMYPAEVVEEIKAEVVEEIEKEMIVPIVPREVAANAETNIKEYIEDNASELEHFDPRKITASVDGAERICTTSMFPTFQPHDIVFVKFLKDKTRITDGKIFYFDTHTHPTMIRLVKKLDNGNLRLIALNARYGDIIIGFDQITNIGEIKGMYRETFSDQYAEMEEIRRRKDAQVDKLVEQNGEALKIIHDLIKR
jgi:phage repressor protein C with HTH and peptisase S24 domain